MNIYLLLAAILVVAEVLYFRIADHFNIIDKPNERSSHSSIVLRGGGIIFLVGVLVWAVTVLCGGFGDGVEVYPWFLLAVTLLTPEILRLMELLSDRVSARMEKIAAFSRQKKAA